MKVHCAMGEPAMPTQGVVTKNSFGNRSVDKGITQPTNNKFWVIEYYDLKLVIMSGLTKLKVQQVKDRRSSKTEGLARPRVRQDRGSGKAKGQARPKVCQGQDSGKAKGPARHQGYT